jgi:hypothetical protein
MNALKRGLRQRTYYYVQPADRKTNNLIKTALPENPVTRTSKEGIGAPNPSSYNLYLVNWADVECFMQISYSSFCVFARKQNECLPRFKMRKNPEIEKRNLKAEKPNGKTLSLVHREKPPIKKTANLAAETKPVFTVSKKTDEMPLALKWSTYVIVDMGGESTNTVTHIWKALAECGLSTSSVRENGKRYEEFFDRVREANGDALFRLWRYARKNPLIRFSALRTTKDGVFENFEIVTSCFKDEDRTGTKGEVLYYQTKKT